MRLRRLVLCLSLFTPGPLTGQKPDTATLAPIVVTATGYPLATRAIASSVTVISGDALRARGITTVADALRLVPGASMVATGSFGGQTSLFLRGGESDYVKVLVDGVPQNQPGGFYDFANLGTGDVERIEIVRGPVSVLYGSDAMTGVIQIFTRSDGSRFGGRLSYGMGRYGVEDAEGTVRGGAGGVRYDLSAARHVTSGIYAFNNRYRRDLLAIRLAARPDARTEASLSARYTEAEFHFPTDYTGVPSDSNQHTGERGPSVGIELRRWLSSRVQTHATLAYHRSVSRYDDGPDSPGDTSVFCCSNSRDVVRRLVFDARADVHVAGGSVVSAGLELERQHQEGTTLAASRHDVAVYAQGLVPAGQALSLTLGGRVEDNEQFGRHLTGRAGLVWRPDAATRIRLAAGSGFKEPSLYENFATGFVSGNPHLRPERSTSWEVGVERSAGEGNVTVAATYFDQRFRDLIQYSPAPVGPDSVNYENVGDATARGLELAATIGLGQFLTLEPSYSLLRARDRTTGDRLLRRPGHTAAVQAAFRLTHRVSATVAARHSGARDDQDFRTFPEQRVSLPAYTVADASIAYQVGRSENGHPGIAVSGGVTNVFDAHYQEVVNFRTPRRAWFVVARLDFGPS